MNDEFRQMVIDALRRGDDLPADWARELFPPEKREYELVYYGKEREEDILADTMAVPLQPVSTFGKNGEDWHNMLILGDNLQAMKTLLKIKEEGKLTNADGTPGVRLIYIDPPFATKREFSGTKDQKAYQDKITGARFVEFLRQRLILMREALAADGSIFVHLDYKKGHYIKTIMDEVFGEQNFRSEIIWKRTDAHNDTKGIGKIHDTILHFSKSSNAIWNPIYIPLSNKTADTWYKHIEEGTSRRYNKADLTARGVRRGETGKPWRGINPTEKGNHWRYPPSKLGELLDQGLIVFSDSGMPYLKRYLDESKGVTLQDIWTDVPMIRGFGNETVIYPTRKPEALLERIISSASNCGDIVMDAFAGSGTTCAVAEKLGRRWIGIDCGKLAIYTIQKNMLNLKSEIGNKGKPLKPKPFTLYNAGLYDFSTLKQLAWADWRFFALQLFGCKDEPHIIGGLELDGKLKGSSVLVFNHQEHPGQRIDEDTVHDIHVAVGKKVGRKFFIIAPRGVFDFQQDYNDLEGVRYYALRIPYSIINELHHREFTALQQPNDENAVNDTVDAVGFDFIQPPKVGWGVSIKKRKGQLLDEACLKIKEFESRARLRGRDTHGGLETFSILMLDFDYNGEVFDLDAVFYAHQLEAEDWQAWFLSESVGANVMAVFIDIYGNESREIIPREKFGLGPAKLESATRKALARAKKKSRTRK